MAEITLAAQTGRPTGSRASNRLRVEGKVPGVVYGHASAPTPVTVDWRELRLVLTTDAGLNALINLELDGERKLSIVKELQRHPVRRTVTHVDFLLISRDEELEVDVPIVLEGESLDVERNDGMIDQMLFSLTIKAKPGSIPNELVVDISGLTIGEAVRVGDLALPDGVVTEVDPEEPIVVAQAAARAEVEEVAEEAAGAEGADAEADEAGEG